MFVPSSSSEKQSPDDSAASPPPPAPPLFSTPTFSHGPTAATASVGGGAGTTPGFCKFCCCQCYCCCHGHGVYACTLALVCEWGGGSEGGGGACKAARWEPARSRLLCFSNTSSEWIHRGRTICSQKRMDGTCNSFSRASKIPNGQFKTSGDLAFRSRTRPHGVDPSETGWEPANFQICRFKKTSEAEHSIRVVDWSQTATQTARTSNYEFASSRAVSRHGSQR